MRTPEQGSATVSAIIPVHNDRQYLTEAIESVLAQRYTPLEIIVVDDGSTDGSLKIAQEYAPAVQTLTQPHSGAGVARNRGVKWSNGELLAFLDADDLWLADKVVRQVEVLNQRADIDIVFGRVEQFISPDLANKNAPSLPEERRWLDGYHPGAMLVRRTAFLQAGYFPTMQRVGEFVDWYARAIDAGLRSVMLPQVVMQRRIHAANQQSWSDQNVRQQYTHMLKDILDRRRMG